MGKLVNINELKIGMVLERDVINRKTGAILIPKGKALTRSFINKLYNNNLYMVYIEENEIPRSLVNQNFVKEYSKVEKKLDNVFDLVKQGEKIDVKDLSSYMVSFVKEVIEISNISTQMKLLKERDDYTFKHSLGVSVLAVTLGKWLGYSEESILELSIIGLLHDIGKLKIPEEIVNKPGKLTPEEFELMKRHSLYSYEILLETGDFNEDILLGVLQHHEKINGTGYPDGLKGEEIHEYAKIIAVCDIYSALTSDRLYKYKDSPFNVADYLREESFQSLDPNIVSVFLTNISKLYVGNKVLLSDGTIGTIVYLHPQNNTKPIVKVDDKFIDFLKEDKLEILDIVI